MTTQLKIYIDRLIEGKTEKIEESLDPYFIDIDEKDLEFPSPVHIQGQTYIAKTHLVIQLKIETSAKLPCLICNEPVVIPLRIGKFYHTEELGNIKGSIYDYTLILREGVLLELPTYVDCRAGCPKRTTIKKYLQTGNQQFPFADL